jgi:hypothetical protein
MSQIERSPPSCLDVISRAWFEDERVTYIMIHIIHISRSRTPGTDMQCAVCRL